MKDLHSHILMGIDDGSKDLQTSIEILKNAAKNNITDILLTPHYIKNSKYMANNEQKQKLLNELKQEMLSNGININLYLGNEVYINDDILYLIKSKQISTLNNSKYILIELPFMNQISNLKEIIFELIVNNYIPIIAHPERYQFVQENPIIIKELIDMGVLFQGNYKSLYGNYGKKAKKTLKILLKNNLIHFLASDIHCSNKDYEISKLKRKIKKIVKDEKKVYNLLENNFTKVINNEDIII